MRSMVRPAACICVPLVPDEHARPGLNFTFHMQRLCLDIVRRLDEFRHVDLSRVAISYCQTRKAVRHGIQATLTPLRFEGGAQFTKRRGRSWTIQRFVDREGKEMLYVLSFYLPRFLELPFQEKLSTVIHELWHIGPQFDGDLRRHPGRCYAHSSSQKNYDAAMQRLTEKYLSLAPPPEAYAFLRCSFRDLMREYGSIYGLKISAPKLLLAQEHAA